MAQPTTFRFGAGAFFLGDGEEPEVFNKLCGFLEATVSIEKDTADTNVPDCDDPDAPSWTERDVVAQSWSMSFSGVLAASALPLLEAATFGTPARNVRMVLAGGGTGVGTPDRQYAGRAHITHSISATRGEKFQVEVSVTGDGPLTATSIAAA